MPEDRPLDQLSSDELFRGAAEPPPEPASESQPEAEPAAETKPEPKPELKPEEKPEAPEAPEAGVPSWRLREEADARRLAEDRARELEQRLNAVAAHLQQQQRQQQQPDFFENPDQAVQRQILQVLQPYAEETRRNLMYMGKMVASAAHGAEKVEEAEQAFLTARANESLDPADYERVVTSPNRYDAVVQWHRRQSVLASVGDDPNAWFEKQLEAKMADPQFQAKLLEKVRGDATGRPAVTRLPPSLSRATASANNAEDVGDLSDSSLFAFARK